jgi:hypothetical protein
MSVITCRFIRFGLSAAALVTISISHANAQYWWCPTARAYYPQVPVCPVWQQVGPAQPPARLAPAPGFYWPPANTAPPSGITRPPSAVLPSGADCEHPQSLIEQLECESFVFKQYGTGAGYAYIARMKEFNDRREKKEDEARQAARAAEAEKWRTGVRRVVHGVSVVPGAIVCPDFPTVQLMFDWYTTHWSDVFRDQVTHGQSSELGGPPLSEPPFESYGCTLVPNGTAVTMTLIPGKLFPTITGQLPSGRAFSGVTFSSMYTP